MTTIERMADKVRVSRVDRRGAHSVSWVSRARAYYMLRNGRSEMTVIDEAGRVIGRKERDPNRQDDQRIKWSWWMEGEKEK